MLSDKDQSLNAQPYQDFVKSVKKGEKIVFTISVIIIIIELIWLVSSIIAKQSFFASLISFIISFVIILNLKDGKNWARILILVLTALGLVGSIISLFAVMSAVGGVSGAIFVKALISVFVDIAINGVYIYFLYFEKNVKNFFRK